MFGRSGSGKGTQAKLLIDYLKENDPERDTLRIETGEGLREFIKQDNHTSGAVKNIMGEGGLLPEFVPIWVWTQKLISNFTGVENLVFDGVSRRVPEAPILDGALDMYGFEERYIVYIDVSEDWATQRLLDRGRFDDNKDEIKKRLEWYKDNVAPAVEYFEKNEKYSFLNVNGEQTIEEVHQSVIDAINKK